MITELLEENPGANVLEYYFEKPWPETAAAVIAEYMPAHSEVQTTKYVEFIYRNLYYTYDCADDAQRLYKRTLVDKHPLTHMRVYKEEILAAQQFPCTQEVTLRREISKMSWRINHRLFLNVEHEMVEDYDAPATYIYLRYNHSASMDLKKIETDFAQWIARIGNHLEKSEL